VKGVTLIGHPLVRHHLTRLRDARTRPQEFRRILGEASALMTYEATRSLATRPVTVKTPLTAAHGAQLRREVILVPILRAGLGMLEAILKLVPDASVGFIGMKREEETLRATVYYKSLPADLRRHEIILIDPMLATGGSAVAAMDLLRERRANRARMVNLLAAPEGLRNFRAHHPGVPIFTAAIDRKLNAKGFIVPGLGDAGDRSFGL